MSRRSFVTAAASLPVAWGVPGARRLVAAERSPRAESVLMIWLWGGPSHLDTFDPKPESPSGIRGPFKPIVTRTPGAHFTELLPQLAQRSHHLSIVRSCRFAGNHDMLPLTGSNKRGSEQEPNIGSVVARHKPVVGMPSFVSLVPRTTLSHGFRCDTVRGHNAGRLGAAYHPFFVRCGSDSGVEIPSLKLMDGLTPERLSDRRQLVRHIDQLKRFMDTPDMNVLDKQNDSALTMLTSRESLTAFDLGCESERTRRAYGRTSFGQSLLLARRLVEAGVPYVQVNWSLGVDGLEEGAQMGWDTHRNGFGQLMNYHCPIFDRALAALLDDLHDRGLLSRTLVAAMGEMGRTPKINSIGGRDHWATCSTLWAGGGVEGGRIIGATDRQGGQPITDPVTPVMVGTTIAEAVGLDSQVRAEMNVLEGGRIIEGLLSA